MHPGKLKPVDVLDQTASPQEKRQPLSGTVAVFVNQGFRGREAETPAWPTNARVAVTVSEVVD